MRDRQTSFFFVATFLFLAPATIHANESAESSDLFAAIESGQVDAEFVPTDATEARLIIGNLTDQAIELRLPASFTGLPVGEVPVEKEPVLGQFGNQQAVGNQQAAGGQPGGGQAGGSQAVGGAVQAGQGQGAGQGNALGQVGNLGFMRIPPGKTIRMKVATVCLQHGRPEPRPKMAYRIVPLSDFSENETVAWLCNMLGQGEVTQPVAQAAVWNVQGLSWKTLANKNRYESKYTGDIKFFHADEIAQAQAIVALAKTSSKY